jgi:hypothetical protein
MKNWFLVLLMIPAFTACVSRTYERDTTVEQRPQPSTVVVPQGSTAAPPNTTVVVPQNSPSPSRDTTVIVPR